MFRCSHRVIGHSSREEHHKNSLSNAPGRLQVVTESMIHCNVAASMVQAGSENCHISYPSLSGCSFYNTVVNGRIIHRLDRIHKIDYKVLTFNFRLHPGPGIKINPKPDIIILIRESTDQC